MSARRMIGVLNVLYENDPGEVRQYYRELAGRCAAEGIAYRVFTLDNSTALLRHLVPEDASYRHIPENLGYTRACNLLMAQAFEAGCDAVVSMNVDGFPLPGCVPSLLATLDRHHGVALVEARQFPKEHPRYYDAATGATDWVSGCCLLIPRRTYERLGPFDEEMFLYCEDVDYSFRAREQGVPCVVSSDALFYHRGSVLPSEPVRRKNALLSARYLAVKWRNLETRKIMEDALINEGYFASPEEMPRLPPTIEQHTGVTWDAAHKMTFAQARWV